MILGAGGTRGGARSAQQRDEGDGLGRLERDRDSAAGPGRESREYGEGVDHRDDADAEAMSR